GGGGAAATRPGQRGGGERGGRGKKPAGGGPRPAVAKAMAGYSPARRSFSGGGEASVPRHKRVHARLDALWDARRLASAWYAASISAFTRVFDARWRAPRVPRTHPNVSRRSAA